MITRTQRAVSSDKRKRTTARKATSPKPKPKERSVKQSAAASNRVLILDDEPEYLQWVSDFFESLGLLAVFKTDLQTAMTELATDAFRLILVDMNVPCPVPIEERFISQFPIVQKYPGLRLALEARNRGYGAHQVIVYTVHDDDAIDKELAKMHCRYVLKGRPQIFKSVIKASLSPPTKGKSAAKKNETKAE